jgi:hypothetical protein
MSNEKIAGDCSRNEESSSTRKERGAIPPRVQAVALHLRLRIVESAIGDIRARYDLGTLVHELRYRFGTMPVKELARLQNMAPATLRRLARVTETICSTEFDEYLALRNVCGQPLTWSHIEELAESRSVEVRRRCARQVLSEGLSIAALRALLRAVAKR